MDVRKPKEAVKYYIVFYLFSKSFFKVSHDIESGAWDPNNPTNFGVSDEGGNVLIFDARKISEPLFNFNAHKKSATSISFSEGIPGLLTTTSLEGTIKIWDT
jgi:periodic tryptophan protein 1